MWYIGQKIVCINAKRTNLLKLNKIYTIEALLDEGINTRGPFTFTCTDPCIITSEIKCPCGIHEPHLPYSQWRFRPLLDKKTDISLFKNLLIPKKANRKLENV